VVKTDLDNLVLSLRDTSTKSVLFAHLWENGMQISRRCLFKEVGCGAASILGNTEVRLEQVLGRASQVVPSISREEERFSFSILTTVALTSSRGAD
jgi:hypothetical protein